MNAKWLFPVSLGLGLFLLGLSGARPQDDPQTARARALRPIIHCINELDVQWRLNHEANNARADLQASFSAYLSNAQEFAGNTAIQELKALRSAVCSDAISQPLKSLEPDSPLLAATETYLQALGRFSTATLGTSYYLTEAIRPSSAEKVWEQAERLRPESDTYLQASTALRQMLTPQDLTQRREQQRQLESRLGRDIHWTLLTYMIQARTTVDLLEQGMREKTLTPEVLAGTTEDLQRFWSAREAFVFGPAIDKRNEEALALLKDIARPAENYLANLRTLHQDWLEHAEPQRLSDDFHAVTRSYDSMLSHYNARANTQF